MSAIIQKLAATAKIDVLEHAKSLPQVGIAEEADFEVWGKKFVAKLENFRLKSELAKIDWRIDKEVQAIIDKATAAYANFDNRAWVEWGAELMLVLTKRIAEEEERARVEAERIRREEEEAAKKAADEAKVEHWVGLLDKGQLTLDEFGRMIAAMDRGELDEVPKKGKRKVEVVIVRPPKSDAESKKRKRSESVEGEPLTRKCQLCEKRGRICIVKAGMKSCTECKRDRKGCRFDRPMEKSPCIVLSDLDSESDFVATNIGTSKPRHKIFEDSEPVARPSRLVPRVIDLHRAKSLLYLKAIRDEIALQENRLKVISGRVVSLKKQEKAELKKLED